jgi:hypothetical protein
MKNTIKRVAVAAACATGSLALLGVSSAAAFPPVGTAVTGVDDGRGIEFRGLTTCHASLSGRVTSLEMFGGGAISVERVSFTGCGGASVTANGLPWTLGTDATTAAVLFTPDVSITTSRGTCRYSGDLLGATNGSGRWSLIGDVYQRAAGCGGPGQSTASVALRLTDSNGNPVGL